MIIFKLPDLGEGLQEAEIREWYIKAGDTVKTDQPLVAMETAKALVDVPAAFDGKIEKLFGEVGSIIETGKPLIGFEGEGEEEIIEEPEIKKDAGTVVGKIEVGGTVLSESVTGVAPTQPSQPTLKATPAVRALAKKLNVDLNTLKPSGERITVEDVKQAAAKLKEPAISEEHLKELPPIRHAMMLSMTESHHNVAPVTLSDDADISAWDSNQDITIRIIRAIQQACLSEPMLNTHFFPSKLAYQQHDTINLGIAIDTKHGLFVPVVKDIAKQDDASLRKTIEQYKEQAQTKSLHADDLHDATIVFSNFGSIAGRYADPIITPPTVAIVGVGRSRDAVVVENKAPAIHRMMPLSITIDHRIVTGGECARFLKAMMLELGKRQ